MSFPLPNNHSLPVQQLNSCFNNTSATYKFYWFLAILSQLEKGNIKINKQHLFAEMVASAWYTINYFHISFGKQDQLQRAIENILGIEQISIEEKQATIAAKLISSPNRKTQQLLRYFDGEVPFRFLSPWFPSTKGDKRSIYALSQGFENKCLYAVDEYQITINPIWTEYLLQHAGILRSFCYWHLSLYLQKHNPNVPDIPNKLIKPAVRGNLTKQRKEFWDVVIDAGPKLSCIYTQTELVKTNYAVEHFVPYAFVSHDLIWNLIPADKRFNSSKSDKLPPLETYFEGYFQMQKQAIKTIFSIRPDSKILQDYLPILPDLGEFYQLGEESLREKFRANIQPLVTIAANNGFEYMSI